MRAKEAGAKALGGALHQVHAYLEAMGGCKRGGGVLVCGKKWR